MLRKIDNNENSTLTDVELYGLKGPVKEIYEKNYFAFPMQGKIFITEKNTKENGVLLNEKIFFNEQGKSTSSILYFINTDNTHHNIKLYSDDGLTTEITSYENDIAVGTTYFKYDDKKRIIETIEISTKSNDTYKTIYGYHEQLNKVNKKTSYTNGQLKDYSFDEYSQDGLLCESKTFDANNTLTFHYMRYYNSKGNTTKVIFYNNDGTISNQNDYTEDFNEDGTYKEGSENLDDYKDFFVQKEIDHYGNFTKLVLFYCNQPFKAITRTITYFHEETINSNDPTLSLPFTLPTSVRFPLLLTNPITESLDRTLINDAKLVLNSPYNELPSHTLKKLVEKRKTNEFAHLDYYTHIFKDYPSPIYYPNAIVDVIGLREQLEQLYFLITINEEYEFLEDNSKVLKSFTLKFTEHEGYLVYADNINTEEASQYDESRFHDPIVVENGMIQLGRVKLLCPSEESGLRKKNLVEYDFNIFTERCMVKYPEEEPSIYLVEVQNSNYILKNHTVKDDFEIDDLDLHYGFGFRKFHQELMERIETDSKGLILFHGAPGTGKTYYIRHLLREIAMSDNIVIYMPPNMVDYLMNPAFMTFLAKTIARYNNEDKYCILLIEDAEPLLVAREADTRIQGITNLLNMTDGLLNDMLKMQIICTFNVDIKHLDPALLRPGRLLARKEFKPLPELEANILAQSLGVNYTFTAPATLAEIYAKLDDHDTIIHDEYR